MEVNSSIDASTARVTVVGDVDTETSPRLEEELNRLIRSGVTTIVLDGSGISFLSSAGLSVLIGAHRDAEQFRVEPGNRIVDRLIDLTGLAMLYGGEQVEPAG